MPTVLREYVEAFGHSVMADHREAMVCCEIVDNLAVGTTLAKRLKAHCDDCLHDATDPERRQLLLELISIYLRFATVAHQLANKFFQRGYAIEGAEDFEEAVFIIRETLSNLSDPTPIQSVKLPTDFAVALPPDAWYIEDHSNMHLPDITKR